MRPPASLRGRLVLVGIAVAIIAVLLTALMVRRLTESDIRGSLDRDLDAEIIIRDSLAFYGADNESWEGVEREVLDLALVFDERIALATLSGEILADSAVLLDGHAAPLPPEATVVDPAGTLIDFEIPPDELERIELENIAIEECLVDAGIPFDLIDDGFGLETAAPSRQLTEEESLAIDACFGELSEAASVFPSGIATPFDPTIQADLETLTSVPPLQLFIGFGTDNTSPFTSERSTWFWVVVVGIVGAAALVTVLMARRIVGPIESLTSAARRMSTGHLDTRVDVGGSTELEQLGSAFNDMAASLQAEDQARQTLTTDVAHELRTPLSNLRGYIEGIQDGVVEAEPETIDLLHEEVDHLQGLVDDLQQLSLAESGRLNLHRVETDIGDLIERVTTANRPSALSASVTLDASTTPGAMITVDPDRIRQVLTNLISNAIQHTQRDGSVQLTLSMDDEVRIEVIDTGSGIPPTDLPHVFDRFYRVDNSRSRQTGGSGLGLAIAAEFVRAHGGSIEVASVLGEGTTFTIVLPTDRTPPR